MKVDELRTLVNWQPDAVREFAEKAVALAPDLEDGWYTATVRYRAADGKVTHIDDVKIVKSE